jgi:hypothetical protein
MRYSWYRNLQFIAWRRIRGRLAPEDSTDPPHRLRLRRAQNLRRFQARTLWCRWCESSTCRNKIPDGTNDRTYTVHTCTNDAARFRILAPSIPCGTDISSYARKLGVRCTLPRRSSWLPSEAACRMPSARAQSPRRFSSIYSRFIWVARLCNIDSRCPTPSKKDEQQHHRSALPE